MYLDKTMWAASSPSQARRCGRHYHRLGQDDVGGIITVSGKTMMSVSSPSRARRCGQHHHRLGQGDDGRHYLRLGQDDVGSAPPRHPGQAAVGGAIRDPVRELRHLLKGCICYVTKNNITHSCYWSRFLGYSFGASSCSQWTGGAFVGA